VQLLARGDRRSVPPVTLYVMRGSLDRRNCWRTRELGSRRILITADVDMQSMVDQPARTLNESTTRVLGIIPLIFTTQCY
jgi:hypothetical protein